MIGGGLGPAPLLLQGATPTVGDTIWVARTVAVPSGRSVRAGPWEPEDPVELLGRPRIVVRDDSAQVAYPVAIWRAGEHTVTPPGPLLVAADGRIDSLPALPVTLRVASVLPRVPADSTLAPQPRADFVPREGLSLLPLLYCWAAAALILLLFQAWWRRPGTRLRIIAGEPPAAALAAPLDRWADAGEARAVAAAAIARLRGAIAARIPAAHLGLDTPALLAAVAESGAGWPAAELAELVGALDQARFGQSSPEDVLALSRRAREFEGRHLRDAA